MPTPLVALPCGSMSTIRTLLPIEARLALRFMAVVVLPTPPFWFVIAMARAIHTPSSLPSAFRSFYFLGQGPRPGIPTHNILQLLVATTSGYLICLPERHRFSQFF